MTAAERYAARKIRVAVDARARLLVAAGRGARHTRLYARYGPDWDSQLQSALNRRLGEWYAMVETNNRFFLPDPESGRVRLVHEAEAQASNEIIWRALRRPRNPGGVV